MATTLENDKYQVIERHKLTEADPSISTIKYMPWLVIKNVTYSSSDIKNIPDTFSYHGLIIEVISSHLAKGAADKALNKLLKNNKSSEEISDKRYKLLLTENQAQVLVDALDLYSRIGMGQLEEVAQILRLNNINLERIDGIRGLLRDAANSWVGQVGSYYGIFSDKINDVFRVAWDIQQVIRNRLAWDRKPEGGMQVHFDKPIKSSKETMITISKV